MKDLLPTRRLSRSCIAALILAPLLMPAASATAQTSPGELAARQALINVLTTDPGPAASSYGTRDSTGASADAIKIIPAPGGAGYIGVYHVNSGQGQFSVRVATSPDLLHWTYGATLAYNASQPTISALPGGAFLVVYERRSLLANVSHLEFREYLNSSLLLLGLATAQFDAPRTLSTLHEGTPSLNSVTVGTDPLGLGGLIPQLGNSVIEVGFHYYDSALRADRNATGVLTNFSSWASQVNTALNGAFGQINGNIGGRDPVTFQGYPFTVVEAQTKRNDFSTFGVYVFDPADGSATRVSPATPGGSHAFGNPRITLLSDPRGREALVSSMFVFSEAAAPGEAGSLVRYTEL